MNITVVKQPKCLADLSVEIAAERVNEQRASLVKEFSSQANIKGFRKGKVPAKVVEKRFRKQIDSELASKMVRAGVDEAVKKESLNLLNVLEPKEAGFTTDGGFKFNLQLLLQPQFELPKYLGLKVAVEEPEVTDSEVEATLENLRQRYAEFNDIDEAAAMGGFLTISYSTTLDGKPVQEATDKPVGFLKENDDYWVKMDEESFLPGFCAELVGLKAGDEKEVTLTLPEDYPIEDLRGKEVVIATTVKAVKEQVLPEIDDELAAKVMPDFSLERLRELIQESALKEKNQQVEDEKVDQIVNQLSEGADFELPDHLIQAEKDNVVRQRLQEALQGGSTDGTDFNALVEQFRAESGEQAEKNLRVHFILQRISEEEKIQVEKSEILGRISEMAQQQKKPIKKLIQELEDGNQIPGIASSILIGKTIDFLVEKAEVVGAESSDSPAESTEEDNA